MKFNLSNAYPLTIITSSELNDDLLESMNPTEVKAMDIIVLLLAAYYPNIKEILKTLMLARKMRA